MAVYLLHFDRPYRHAKHYLGFAHSEAQMHRRIRAHVNATRGDGKNHRLLVAIRQAGISFTVARVWPEGTRAQERSKKKAGKSRICPLCREQRPSTV